MRFLNASHEPTSLVISRFLFLVIGITVLIFLIFNQFSDLLELDDIYLIAHQTEPLAVPSILFRTTVAFNLVIDYDVTIANNSHILNKGNLLADFPNWKENLIDSSYPIQDWRIFNELYISRSLNNSVLSMFMLKPNISAVFVPKTHNNVNRLYMDKTPINELNIKVVMDSINSQFAATKHALKFHTDIFFISNPDLLNSTKYGKPFDLATVDYDSRFTVKSGTNNRLSFLKSYKEKNGQAETIYDFKFYEQPGTDPAVAEFTIVPRNKPSEDNNGFIVKREIARHPVSWFQAVGAIGGAISLFIVIYTIFFGQSRLRPWGIIQRYIMRNKMLSILPQSMVSIKSYYNPEFNHGPAADMKGLNKTNPEPYKTAFRSSKSTVNTYRQDPPNNDISQRIPSILINGEQPYSSTADAHASEISKLKTMIAAQMKQATVMSDQLAMLESNLSTNNSTILLDKSTLDNTCLSNTSMAQYSEPFVSSRSAAAFETRLSNIEAFQSRLGTFYLSSDLFKDD